MILSIGELRLAPHWWLTCHTDFLGVQMLATHSSLLVSLFFSALFLVSLGGFSSSSQYQRSSGLSPLLLTVTYLPGHTFCSLLVLKTLVLPSSSSSSKFPAGLFVSECQGGQLSARLNILQKVIDINTFLPQPVQLQWS